jgi:hypothetical protein
MSTAQLCAEDFVTEEVSLVLVAVLVFVLVVSYCHLSCHTQSRPVWQQTCSLCCNVITSRVRIHLSYIPVVIVFSTLIL